MNKRDFFDQIAREWEDEHNIEKENEQIRLFAQNFNLATGSYVLDIGCGTGRLIPHIKDAIGEKGYLIEADFSQEMLKIGKSNYFFANLFL